MKLDGVKPDDLRTFRILKMAQDGIMDHLFEVVERVRFSEIENPSAFA